MVRDLQPNWLNPSARQINPKKALAFTTVQDGRADDDLIVLLNLRSLQKGLVFGLWRVTNAQPARVPKVPIAHAASPDVVCSKAAIVSTAAVIVQTQFRIAGRIGGGKDRVPASASVALRAPLSGA